jgi:hypothetical protein
MNLYIATFHTHYSALSTCRAFQNAGQDVEMAPVPRVLSADCGTCLRFFGETVQTELLHQDFDRVVIELQNGSYQTVVTNDAP